MRSTKKPFNVSKISCGPVQSSCMTVQQVVKILVVELCQKPEENKGCSIPTGTIPTMLNLSGTGVVGKTMAGGDLK